MKWELSPGSHNVQEVAGWSKTAGDWAQAPYTDDTMGQAPITGVLTPSLQGWGAFIFTTAGLECKGTLTKQSVANIVSAADRLPDIYSLVSILIRPSCLKLPLIRKTKTMTLDHSCPLPNLIGLTSREFFLFVWFFFK